MDLPKTYSNDKVGVVKVYNTLVKKYATQLKKYKKYNYDINKGFVLYNKHNGSYSEEEKLKKMKQYLKKVRSNIIDLALNNSEKFDYFITLTFDIKNYSHDKALKMLSVWFHNQRQRNKGMYYLIVPEFHKSGRIHFHGLIGNVPKWTLTPSINPHTGKKIYINGVQIFNLKNYDLGFTTISKIQDKEKVCNYISKYATKDIMILKNKKKYWYSRNLERVDIEYFYSDNDIICDIKNEVIRFAKDYETTNKRIELVDTIKFF